jgi:hypothetical protein
VERPIGDGDDVGGTWGSGYRDPGDRRTAGRGPSDLDAYVRSRAPRSGSLPPPMPAMSAMRSEEPRSSNHGLLPSPATSPRGGPAIADGRGVPRDASRPRGGGAGSPPGGGRGRQRGVRGSGGDETPTGPDAEIDRIRPEYAERDGSRLRTTNRFRLRRRSMRCWKRSSHLRGNPPSRRRRAAGRPGGPSKEGPRRGDQRRGVGVSLGLREEGVG